MSLLRSGQRAWLAMTASVVCLQRHFYGFQAESILTSLRILIDMLCLAHASFQNWPSEFLQSSLRSDYSAGARGYTFIASLCFLISWPVNTLKLALYLWRELLMNGLSYHWHALSILGRGSQRHRSSSTRFSLTCGSTHRIHDELPASAALCTPRI